MKEVTLTGLSTEKIINIIRWLCNNFDDGQWQIGSRSKDDYLSYIDLIDKDIANVPSGFKSITVLWARKINAVYFKTVWGGNEN